jgi:carbon storage regulator
MLVLSRKLGEAIVIGDGVTIKVMAVDGGRVKLGVVAPLDVPVHREEIHERIATRSGSLRYAECACV